MTEKITGELANIIFRNEDSDFFIGRFENDEREFKAKGIMINPQLDLTYTLYGIWQDSQYGPTFDFTTYEVAYPATVEAISRYLVKTAMWVGPAVARDLLNEFGVQTMEVLRKSPEEVARKIRGITLARALEIQQNMIENEEVEKVLIQLEDVVGGLGMKRTLPAIILKKWGNNSPEIVKMNPYILIQLHGVGFLSADHIAMKRLNFDPDSPKRIAACLNHVLDLATIKGSSWIHRIELLEEVGKLTGCKPHLIEVEIDDLIEKREWVCEEDCYTRVSMWNDERFVAEKLLALRDYYADRIDRRTENGRRWGVK